MNLHRFTEIVSAYGSNPQAWPVEERQVAVNFLDNNPSAQALILEEKFLDDQLDNYTLSNAATHNLKASIISAIEREPSNFMDVLLNWVLPGNPVQLWRPLFAATLPLIVGTLVGLNIEDNQLDVADRWDDEIDVMFYIDSGDFPNE